MPWSRSQQQQLRLEQRPHIALLPNSCKPCLKDQSSFLTCCRTLALMQCPSTQDKHERSKFVFLSGESNREIVFRLCVASAVTTENRLWSNTAFWMWTSQWVHAQTDSTDHELPATKLWVTLRVIILSITSQNQIHFLSVSQHCANTWLGSYLHHFWIIV